MAQPFSFTLSKTHSHARAGSFTTAHGVVETPIFMPVGTAGTVKSIDTQDIKSTNAHIILGNTYHLYLRPGLDILQEVGGMHGLMGWDKPILTDSGGFQVFSLGEQLKRGATGKTAPAGEHRPAVKLTEEGAEFTSHLDGSKHFFSPERAIEIQRVIGADIIMAFDQCTADTAPEQDARRAMELTHRWAARCVSAWESAGRQSIHGHYQALFGIVQGALHRELRQESARFMASLPVDGIAVGGETIGYNMTGSAEVMDWIRDLLPEDKPRYAMGLGRDPQDIVSAVQMGFDMFDCVGPTRLARNGALYVGELDTTGEKWLWQSKYSKGRLNIGNAEFAHDQQVIQADCDCYTCQAGYSRAYLHHLYRAAELTYYRLASIHNVRTMVRLSQQLRTHLLSL